MARPIASLLALVLAAALGLGATSCGGEDAELLPGETAREITANLDAVEQLADEGDCEGAENAAAQVSEQVDALQEVDPRLERALREGAARLEEVVSECEEPSVEAVPPPARPDGEEAEEQPERERERGRERGRDGNERRHGEDGDGDGNEGEGPPPHARGEGEGEGRGEEGGREPESGGEDGAEGPSGGLSPASAVDAGE